MKNFEEKARVIIDMEGNADEKLKQLKRLSTELREEIAKVGKDTEGGKKLQSQLREVRNEMQGLQRQAKNRIELIIDGKVAGKNIRDTEAALRVLRQRIRGLDEDSKEFKVAVARAQDLDDKLTKLNKTVKGSGGFWSGLSKEVKAFGLIAAGILGFQFITAQIGNVINRNAALSDSFADVAKTSNLSLGKVEELYQELGDLNTRSSRKDLMLYAVEAGKLGKESVRDIKAFVKEADILNVALGDALGEGAVTKIGKLSDIFHVSMLQIGSAVNEVANKSKASEGWQVEFLSNISGVAQTTKLAANELLGYGSVLENLGQTQEVASTALKTFFIEFVRDAEKYGQVAGFTRGELRKLMNEKGTNEAFIQFLDKLKQGSANSEDLLKKLQALGIDGARGATVFLTLAENIGMVKEQQAITTGAIKDGSSAIKEFEVRNENFAAKLEKTSKILYGAFVNSALMSSLEKMVTWFVKLNEVKLSDTMEKERLSLNMTQIKLQDVNMKQEERVQLINELKAQYPEYLSMIDSETVSNQELNASLDKINASLINKILVQKEEEKIKSQAETSAQALDKKLKAETKLVEALQEAREKYNLTLTQGTILEQAEAAKADIKKQLSLADQGYSNETFAKLGIRLIAVNVATDQFNHQMDIGNTLLREKNDLMTRLGIGTEKAADAAKDLTKETEAALRAMADAGNKDAAQEIERRKDAAKDLVHFQTEEQKKSLEETRKANIKNLEDIKLLKIEAIQDEELREAAKTQYLFEKRKREILDSAGSMQIKSALIEQEERKLDMTLTDIYTKFNDKRTADEISAHRRTVELRKALAAEGSEQRLRLEIQALNIEEGEKLRAEKATEEEKLLITQEYNAKRKALNDAYLNAQNEKMWQSTIDAKEHAVMIAEDGSSEKLIAQLDLLNVQMLQELDVAGLTEQKKFEIWSKFEQLKKDAAEQNRAEWLQGFEEATGSMKRMMAGAFEFINALEERALSKDKKVNDSKKKELKRRLDAGLINEESYNKQVAVLNDQFEQKRKQAARDAAVRAKSVALFEAVINTASAVVEALPNLPLSIMAGVLGGIQIATIGARPLPELGKGGIIPKGSSHQEGGMDVIDRNTGQAVANIEGGEPIFSKETYRNNPELVNLLLDSGGRELTKEEIMKVIENGGLVKTLMGAEDRSAIERVNAFRNYENAIDFISKNTQIPSEPGSGGRPSTDGKGTVNVPMNNTDPGSTEGKGAVNVLDQANATTYSTEGKGTVNIDDLFSGFSGEGKGAVNFGLAEPPATALRIARPAVIDNPRTELNTSLIRENELVQRGLSANNSQQRDDREMIELIKSIKEAIEILNKPSDKKEDGLKAAIDKLNNHLENPKPSKSYIVQKELDDSQKMANIIKKNARLN